MSETLLSSILPSIITGIITVVSVLASNSKSQAVTNVKLETTNEKIETLTAEVKKHNNFAERIPVIEEQIKVANHRIDDLEKGRN